MYKKDLQIENPKKFQRHINDIASNVLFKRGYYLNKTFSKFPILKANGIVNIADFHGVLCFVKYHRNYNLLLRVIGAVLTSFGVGILIPTYFEYFSYSGAYFVSSIILIAIGMLLILLKFGKDICIKIRLVGESYRTDIKKEVNSIEYLNVKSHARLTIQASTLDPRKTLNDNDAAILREAGAALTAEFTPFLEKYVEKDN